MKKNEKSTKTTAKKSAASTKAVKKTSTSKAAPAKKVTAKTSPKKTVQAAKVIKTKATATKKTATKVKVTAKATPKKTVKASKPAAKKAAAPKATAKTVKKAVAPAKAAPKKVEAKKVTKPVAKKAIAPVKAAPKKAEAKKAVKTEAPKVKVQEKAAIEVAPPTKAASPIIVKMPQNQNMPEISTGAPKAATKMAAQKLSTIAPNLNAVKPAYRPIQVINKPLTPVQPARQMAPVEKESEKVEFKKGDYVCYPAHGVGEIEAVETQTIGGMEIKLYAIAFEKDRMRLKVPVAKAHASGLRRLSSAGRMEDALKTLQGRAHVRRAMWSRRAQEYETKINSGDPVSIAEVLRDLKRSNDDTEQSYSERQIYQSALERLAREVAAVEKISEEAAAERLENMIKGRKARASASKEQAA
ncbi:MAG: CarD family transcriptional regulator [Pseudobdellovibrionaceae bacterium]|nr:CarD family transcriptional regulator [Pseudobdellovibrionaceae bacterium]